MWDFGRILGAHGVQQEARNLFLHKKQRKIRKIKFGKLFVRLFVCSFVYLFVCLFLCVCLLVVLLFCWFVGVLACWLIGLCPFWFACWRVGLSTLLFVVGPFVFPFVCLFVRVSVLVFVRLSVYLLACLQTASKMETKSVEIRFRWRPKPPTIESNCVLGGGQGRPKRSRKPKFWIRARSKSWAPERFAWD